MSQRVGIEVSIAAAEAVGLADADVVAAYPITPQTHVVEHLAEMVAEGRLKAQYVAVESEHSAISASMGAAAAGARAFTATSSQGLALMHEILFATSSMRLPLVMVVANRALSAPINIWVDHSDIMPQRDTGWGQLFAMNGQEVFDLTLQAFKVAEDHRVLLPMMINMDGFILSHMIEPIEMMSKEQAMEFLPPIDPARMLDPANPRSLGVFGAQNAYTEVKKAQEVALQNSARVWREVWQEFGRRFGRNYQAVDAWHTQDAELVFVTMGSASETALSAVQEMRAKGQKVGLVNLRQWRPFPAKEVMQAIADASQVAVLDRLLSPGSQAGPLGLELRSMYYGQDDAPIIWDFVAGLGGRQISRRTFKELYRQAQTSKPGSYNFLDARLS